MLGARGEIAGARGEIAGASSARQVRYLERVVNEVAAWS
jgi:hypothetical protein